MIAAEHWFCPWIHNFHI